MGKTTFNARRRLTLAGLMVALAVLAPAFTSAAGSAQVTPLADGWVSAARPVRNFGGTPTLRVRAGAFETYLRFSLAKWAGQPADGLELVLAGLSGDPTGLTATRVANRWREQGLTYATRPHQIGTLSVPAIVAADGVHFPLGALFDSGTIDRAKISLRITGSTADLVKVSSREGAQPPILIMGAAPAREISATGDTYVTPVEPDANYGSLRRIAVDGVPQAEAYLAFDVSPWLGRRPAQVQLSLSLSNGGDAGATVYRIVPGWTESGLTWNNRPEPGAAITAQLGVMTTGSASIDISDVFPNGIVDSPQLALRIATTSANGFLFTSREGGSAPQLIFTPRSALLAPPGSPSPAPTETPRATPTPTPTRSPSPTPTASPSPSPTPSPTPTPTPTPLFHFSGQGSDHGVGMSQYGARGRAAAGQTYDQILGHYYTDTTLGTVDPAVQVRVMLNSGFAPTASAPARITARLGGWTSAAFVDDTGALTAFPADSYLQLEPGEAGWTATAYDANGVVLASVATTDVTMTPADSTTRLEMTWRSSLQRYILYRGAMRLLVSGFQVQAINIVSLDDYVKGVVPAEMPPLWPIEAVKAQAVAARGYAYVHLHPDRAWDVVPTSANQVYGGATLEHPRSDLAVDATAGQVVMYNGVPANTFFFTVAGGYTENNEYAWPGSSGKVVAAPIPYLRGVPDYDENGLAYDRNAPGFAWQSNSFSWAQLSAMLAADGRTNVGTLLDIQFKRGVSGRAYCVTLVGTTRTVNVSGAMFKAVFNANNGSTSDLRSTMYFLEPES